VKELAIGRRGEGFAARGRAFYAWEEDEREARAWAAELRAAERGGSVLPGARRPRRRDGSAPAGPGPGISGAAR
jgi:hypothetical protein